MTFLNHLSTKPLPGFLLGFIFLASAILSSCSFGSATVTDNMSDHGQKAVLEAKKVGERKQYAETIDLLGKSAVVFSVFLTDSVSTEIAELLHNRIGSKLLSIDLYTTVLDDDALSELLRKNSRFAQAKDLYLDSVTVVSVSDKDISNPLGNYLATANFLIFQLDRWPCPECGNNATIRMKMRIVDAETSHIIWTGIAEKKKLKSEDLADLEKTALKLADELVERFYNRFKKKWHRQRFDNLQQSLS